TIMQSAQLRLLDHLMPFEKAEDYMKKYAEKSYGRKGEAVLQMNYAAIEAGYKHLVEVEVKPEGACLEDEVKEEANRPSFVKKIADIVNANEGDSLAVAAALGYEDGHMDNGAAAYEKRGTANFAPGRRAESCIQRNQCVFACP